MPRQLIRLRESRKGKSFDDQKSATEIANAETDTVDQDEFQDAKLSQLKRIIHGNDAPGRWYDDPASVFGEDASLKALLGLKDKQKPLVLDFDWQDFPGPLLIGEVSANAIVRETLIEIKESFDGGLGITIGDPMAQARLQAIADNQPEHESYFAVNNRLEFTIDTNVYIYFPTGTPTTGSGRVIVYLN